MIKCFDFTSQYPFVMLACKFPMERFSDFEGRVTIKDILKQSDEYAFIFKVAFFNIHLKDPHFPMPPLQYYKCTKTVDAVVDNGYILAATYAGMYLNEIDLKLITDFYTFDNYIIENCKYSLKGYLPRWLTDYVYRCFKDKCLLKGGDPVLYAIAKARLNSLYGMCVQKPCKPDIFEDYETGDFETEEVDMMKLYEKYIKNNNTVLSYQWGAWVTSYAKKFLFTLGSFFKIWLYSDTDSVYGIDPDMEKIASYNNGCKKALKKNGYDPVMANGKEYCLGVATDDDDESFIEFITLGAKRYAKRRDDGKLSITVAGVPKGGVECLDDNIANFKKGFIFPGVKTGKLTHEHIFVDNIYIDENGNETGDSINLYPCDYLLDQTEYASIDDLFEDSVEVQVYDEE